MKKFKFRLQKLLDIREKKEDLAKREFSKALNKLESEKERLLGLNDELSQQGSSQKALRKGGVINPLNETVYMNYYLRMRNNITGQQIQINQAQNVLERRRSLLIQSSKDKKVLETLKDRKVEEYKLETDKEEQKFIDELATMRSSIDNELHAF